MKPSELRGLRELTTGEIEEKLSAAKEELFNLRFQLLTGHLEDHATVSKLRRKIAQLYTILAERRLAG
ncbi:MAG: 50S ribosomal protein L29 [Candidatus Eremiobacteraeota bacterium]|nr:50S ribosomal protein L29 [Candidatus Eremiobacteraeota bacterium]MBV8204961.1 50S ribosomal protein L29 [Candidatus Eremiobacteraeota bacterium]MBV8262986.1 50S ribosomal protein L29 [Candidatus Eremiobacteraeota bacterium]MBV8339297.1 50S ribosomal protein L29 [Candidatus Eremiobacteraeota bacterium]MBV8461564.1 50S ribosomal protein L29 [Candidatus Eremiobacteraeota bacterium]